MASGFSLKDQLFNAEKVRYLAGLFAGASAAFNADDFQTRVMARLPELELKARISWISEQLAGSLPGDLPDVAPVLMSALPPPLDPSKTDDDFGDFIFAPLGELVVARGLESHLQLSLDMLEALTQRFSMEWAIRPFLNRWPDEVLARMQDWVGHDSYHVRRLVSEGTRPRLPWGESVCLALPDPLPLLDRLHIDPTRYVTRSIANHLNDITKKNPDLVLDQLVKWKDLGQQSPKELQWMTAHALRGLVKAGYPAAMAQLGYDPDIPVEVRLAMASSEVQIGDVLEFTCDLTAANQTPVLIDYRIEFQRPSGKTSVKVFKLKQAKVGSRGLVIGKRHRLKGDATTFKLVPGPHKLDVMVNGRVRASAEFDLLG